MKKWRCPICNHLNSEDTEVCERCGAYKEETSYDAIADEDDLE
jgi:rubrerythrin